MTYTPETELRAYAQAYYTPVHVAERMAYFVKEDILQSGDDSLNWNYWDPAAGSGRLYEQMPTDRRFASDILSFDFQYKHERRFFPDTDFFKKRFHKCKRASVPYTSLQIHHMDRTYRTGSSAELLMGHILWSEAFFW